jgi:hypothetical protein
LEMLLEFMSHGILEEGRDGRDELTESEEWGRAAGVRVAHLQEAMFIRSGSNNFPTLVLKRIFLLLGIVLALLHLQKAGGVAGRAEGKGM